MNYIKPIAKALTAAGVAACAIAATALADGVISPVEWCGIVGGTLASLGAVYGVPNTPNRG